MFPARRLHVAGRLQDPIPAGRPKYASAQASTLIPVGDTADKSDKGEKGEGLRRRREDGKTPGQE